MLLRITGMFAMESLTMPFHGSLVSSLATSERGTLRIWTRVPTFQHTTMFNWPAFMAVTAELTRSLLAGHDSYSLCRDIHPLFWMQWHDHRMTATMSFEVVSATCRGDVVLM